MKQRIKLNAVVILLSVAVLVLFPFKLFRYSAGFWDDILEIAGIVSILCGQLLRVSARGHKALVSANGHSLVKDGPYGLVRNPMYLGILMIGLGVVLFVFEVWVFVVFVGLFLIRYIHLFSIEERHLRDIFKDEFTDYCRRVPRLLPRPQMLLFTDVQAYLPVRMSWFGREWFSISVILLSVLTLEAWEAIRTEGYRVAVKEMGVFLGIILLYIVFVWYLSKRNEKSRS